MKPSKKIEDMTKQELEAYLGELIQNSPEAPRRRTHAVVNQADYDRVYFGAGGPGPGNIAVEKAGLVLGLAPRK